MTIWFTDDMLAGFVSPGLVASTNAVVNAYAFYVMGTTYGVQRQRLEEGVCRWLFGTLLTARYSTSSETKYEEDLGRVRDASKVDPTAFVQTLDDMLGDVLTNDYWNQTLLSALDTQRGRAPAALAFRAAQIILGAKALFGDQPLQNLLAAPGGGGRAASEMHHLFPKAWLHDRGITERKKVNQVANLADVGWHDNSSMGSQSPSKRSPFAGEARDRRRPMGQDVRGTCTAAQLGIDELRGVSSRAPPAHGRDHSHRL